nr:ATP-binding cassette domain-containing protein [Klebsiella pneumoniae]
MSGVYRPDEGAAMTLGGKTWPKLTPAASVAHGIGDLSGSVAVSQSQRVGEHCYKPLSSRRAGEAQRTATQCGAGDAQYNVSLPLDAAVESLSIARCQLVAICRALAQDARLIIMDEPTASLTHQEVEGLLHVVRQLRERGSASSS